MASVVETGSQDRGGMTFRGYRVRTRTKSITISTFVDPASGKFAQFLISPAGE